MDANCNGLNITIDIDALEWNPFTDGKAHSLLPVSTTTGLKKQGVVLAGKVWRDHTIIHFRLLQRYNGRFMLADEQFELADVGT